MSCRKVGAHQAVRNEPCRALPGLRLHPACDIMAKSQDWHAAGLRGIRTNERAHEVDSHQESPCLSIGSWWWVGV